MENIKQQHITEELLPFLDEVEHLQEVQQYIDIDLQDAQQKVENVDQEYTDFKAYMSDYRGELDPHEMFQNHMLLQQIDQAGVQKMNTLHTLKKIQESPYFARIDFLEHDEKEQEIIYIGRFSYMHEYELLIVDWRSPIASIFYDYELGPASYDAPMKTIQGSLLRKRQFQLSNGTLEYVLESSLHIQDDLLKRVLSQSSDEKMKSIISTIQKEQNQVIRNDLTKSMVIQGVAGSGKTSIALHRIAFLLYQYKQKLTGRNVAILSPNQVFGNYISTVLPELGEEPIYQFKITDLIDIQLQDHMKFMSASACPSSHDQGWEDRMRFKSTMEFVNLMDTFIKDIAQAIFVAEAYTTPFYTIPSAFIQERFLAYRFRPFKQRLPLVAYDLQAELKKNVYGSKVPTLGVIRKRLNQMMQIKNTLALYKRFYLWAQQPSMLVFPESHTLEWADVFPYLYMKAAYEGLQESSSIQHLLIDEMQDYTPIQFMVINRIFPCQKTILGDFGQQINAYHSHTLQDVQAIYGDAISVELIKSYRSSFEIITFANAIQPAVRIDPIIRHGEPVKLIAYSDRSEKTVILKGMIQQFNERNYTSLGIILKTDEDASALYRELNLPESNYISYDSTNFHKGVSITSISMSKGLEFDEVVIVDVDAEAYHNEFERGLLYVASTRAMHTLTLLYSGTPSPFLPAYVI